jgi:predicted  nucleic acid-binding Zn-ribbon protein
MEAYKNEAHALMSLRGEQERITQENQRLRDELLLKDNDAMAAESEMDGLRAQLADARREIERLRQGFEAIVHISNERGPTVYSAIATEALKPPTPAKPWRGNLKKP